MSSPWPNDYQVSSLFIVSQVITKSVAFYSFSALETHSESCRVIKTSRYSYGPNLTYRCFGEPSSGSASVASTSSTSPWSTSTCPTRSWRSPETSPYVWSRGSEDLSRSSSSLTTPGNYPYVFLANSAHYAIHSTVLYGSHWPPGARSGHYFINSYQLQADLKHVPSIRVAVHLLDWHAPATVPCHNCP